MKAERIFLKLFPIFLVLLIVSSKTVGQDAANDEEASAMLKKLETKNFVFVAQTAMPQRGTSRHLTSNYDLRVSNDSLTCNLPYFGRAYSAPMDASSGGINFVSTSFDYTVKPKKKNSWDVVMKPKDKKDVQQLLLNVFSSGSAYLQVTSNNRQPMSFNGNVK